MNNRLKNSKKGGNWIGVGTAVGVYAVFFVIPVAYCFAKDIFDENRLVKNIFYIVMLIYLLYLAFAVITE